MSRTKANKEIDLYSNKYKKELEAEMAEEGNSDDDPNFVVSDGEASASDYSEEDPDTFIHNLDQFWMTLPQVFKEDKKYNRKLQISLEYFLEVLKQY